MGDMKGMLEQLMQVNQAMSDRLLDMDRRLAAVEGNPMGGGHQPGPPSHGVAGELPEGWEERRDFHTGNSYYQNIRTMEKQWHLPSKHPGVNPNSPQFKIL